MNELANGRGLRFPAWLLVGRNKEALWMDVGLAYPSQVILILLLICTNQLREPPNRTKHYMVPFTQRSSLRLFAEEKVRWREMAQGTGNEWQWRGLPTVWVGSRGLSPGQHIQRWLSVQEPAGCHCAGQKWEL